MQHFNCAYAKVHLWQDSSGAWWETFYLPEEVTGSNNPVTLDNKIGRPAGRTQTPPGKVLENRGLCVYPPPATAATTAFPTPINAQVSTAPAGSGGGAILLVLALVGSAAYAFVQQRNSKGDFDSDYHPMADAPLLPPVSTDASLDVIYERVSYPQYQGITEPSPWGETQVYPRTQSPEPVDVRTSEPASEPVVQRFSEPVREPVQPSGSESGSEAHQHFEAQVLPAPKDGYYLTEESLQNKGIAYWLLWQAIQLDYSKNWCAQNLFKIAKGANSRYQIFSQLYDRVKGELA